MNILDFVTKNGGLNNFFPKSNNPNTANPVTANGNGDYVAPTYTAPTYTPPPEFNQTLPDRVAPNLPQVGGFVKPDYNYLTWEQAKGQANDVYGPQFQLQLQQAMKDITNQSMGSGFFGQLPQVQLSADTGATIEAEKQLAVGQLANQKMYEDYQKGENEYNKGYQLWRDNTSDAYNKYGLEYGAYRDTVGDDKDKLNFDYNKYADNRNFNRSNFESDRDFGYNQFSNDRNFNRGVFESDRNYDRGVLESDRAYNQDEKWRNVDNGWRNREAILNYANEVGYVTPELASISGLKVGTKFQSTKQFEEQLKLDQQQTANNTRMTNAQIQQMQQPKAPTQQQLNVKYTNMTSDIFMKQLPLFRTPWDFLVQMKKNAVEGKIPPEVYDMIQKRADQLWDEKTVSQEQASWKSVVAKRKKTTTKTKTNPAPYRQNEGYLTFNPDPIKGR